jgi:hypothetical protein
MMSGTLLMQKTGTDTDLAARRVSRRVHGDLESMIEKLAVTSATDISSLIHDLRVAIAHDCLELLSVFLYQKGADRDAPQRVYEYRRVARGTFEESAHSGRITYDPALAGGRIEFQVTPRNRAVWDKLKTDGELEIPWSPCKGRSTAGMTLSEDGGYGSGSIGLARSCRTRS